MSKRFIHITALILVLMTVFSIPAAAAAKVFVLATLSAKATANSKSRQISALIVVRVQHNVRLALSKRRNHKLFRPTLCCVGFIFCLNFRILAKREKYDGDFIIKCSFNGVHKKILRV